MDGDTSPGNGEQPVDPPSRPRPIRAGLIAAALWFVIGLAAAWVSALAGAPEASGSLALVSGVAALLIAGRLNDLHHRNDWIGAAVVAILSVAILGGAAIFVFTILAYG
jgi:hypothetical protein